MFSPMSLSVRAEFKKKMGLLRVVDSSLIFTVEGVVEKEINVHMVKAQHVSTAKSPKIALKLTFKDDSVILFTFQSNEDRDMIKNTVTELIQAKTPKTEPILVNDIDTLKYSKLVKSGIMTDSEFWETRKEEIELNSFTESLPKGKPNEMLTQVTPSTETGADIKYTLTPEIEESIFTQYPVIRKAYNENVGSKLTEKEFWITYFQSKFFLGEQQGKRSLFDAYPQPSHSITRKLNEHGDTLLKDIQPIEENVDFDELIKKKPKKIPTTNLNRTQSIDTSIGGPSYSQSFNLESLFVSNDFEKTKYYQVFDSIEQCNNGNVDTSALLFNEVLSHFYQTTGHAEKYKKILLESNCASIREPVIEQLQQ